MSYIQKSYRGTPIWIGGLIALVLLGRCAAGFGDLSSRSAERLDTPEAVARNLLSDPETSRVYATMKRTHPKEFSALTWEIAGRVKDGQPQKTVETAVLNFMFDAEERHREELNQAGPAAMAAYRLAEIRVIEALKKLNPEYCATYVTTGQFRLPPGVEGPRATFADLHVATWQAYADGRDHPVGRKLPQPTQGDWASIDKAMIANGIDRKTIALFFDPAKNAQLSPAVQCDAGLAFRHAIETLPAGKIDQFFIGLINANPAT